MRQSIQVHAIGQLFDPSQNPHRTPPPETPLGAACSAASLSRVKSNLIKFRQRRQPADCIQA
jgi:hypothetical protein